MENEFREALLEFNKDKVEKVLQNFLDQGNSNQQLISIITNTFYEIGTDWENGTISLSQIYMSSKICEQIIDRFLPAIDNISLKRPLVGIVTFYDFHVLGKKIVYSVLKSNSFNIIDYGSMSVAADIVKRVNKDKLDFLLISTLMLHSALRITEIKKEFLKSGNETTKIMVGGAPFIFDKELWKKVGADSMGVNPSEAITYINSVKF